ncbi:hypothetical protein ABT294_50300 [Nonomuraea sp. NPDC000554]|uniref:hypothetical protein n=1 Tax=Nonomuraea sp. NPDC000554 TaxID=3154259 RepID=UPI003316A44A
MTITRRQALTLGAALAMSACAPEASQQSTRPTPPGGPGTLFAETASGLVRLDLASGTVTGTYPGAVAGARWARLYQLDHGLLRTYTAATGRLVTTTPVPGQQIKAVSGRVVAVAPAPGPRRRTTITLATEDGNRTLELDGNIEPEAFSGNGQVMYVLDYLPPDRPERYRVRMVDLDSGRPAPLHTRDKKVIPAGKEEEMRGRGRQAVLDPDASVLYTLYTHQDDHLHTRDLLAGRDLDPGVHAFVHVLNLNQFWAYCLDLPAPFGLGPAQAHTIALAPESKRLYVFDASTGRVVQASTDDLTIRRSGFLGRQPGEAFAVTDGDRLYLGAGSRVQVADGETLAPRAAWDLPGQARGLAWLDGELLAGAGEQVLRLRSDTGGRLAAITVPGLRTVLHAEPVTG